MKELGGWGRLTGISADSMVLQAKQTTVSNDWTGREAEAKRRREYIGREAGESFGTCGRPMNPSSQKGGCSLPFKAVRAGPRGVVVSCYWGGEEIQENGRRRDVCNGNEEAPGNVSGGEL